MSERIERYAVVNDDGRIVGFYPTLQCAEDARRGEWSSYRIIRLTELRDGESIAVNDDPGRAFKVGDRVRLLPSALDEGVPGDLIGRPGNIIEWHERNLVVDMGPGELNWTLASKHLEHFPSRIIPERELNAAIERAEEAEAALQGAEFAHEAASKNAKGWHDRALSAESQLNDARKRYRDDTAAKLLAAEYADNDAALPAGTTTDQYWINRAKWALIVAQHLTDAAFGFPPAKEVSNG